MSQEQKTLQPHQQRVVVEQQELNDRLEKLQVFINENPLFKSLIEEEQMDLQEQSVLMSQLNDVLIRRISRFWDSIDYF